MAAERHRIPLHLVPDTAPVVADDSDLARALIAGEPWAPAATWNRFAPMVFRMASRALGNDDEAEDVEGGMARGEGSEEDLVLAPESREGEYP